MALRPLAFSIPSTTQLKITFSDELNESISADNFIVTSLNGAVQDLDILGVTIAGSVVTVKTRPQVSGNYYLLKFVNTDEVPFASTKGQAIPFDSVSRELFFVGIDSINPFRDRMFGLTPDLFEIENTNLKNIYSAQAEEFYTAQKTVGEVLSNNYLCIDVLDEPRTRTAGATDRLANENAYEVIRVGKFQTGSNPIFEILDYTSDNDSDRLKALPVYPVSLQQVLVDTEEISIGTTGNSFDGYLLSLLNRNVIKILSIKYIADGEEVDCNGQIGVDYNVERFKYSIKDNFYDQDFAFRFAQLEDNQVLLSEFGNIPKPSVLDTIQVSYLYKNKGRYVLEDQVEVSRVEESINESVPTNSTNFFLDHGPIVNIDNQILTRKGVRFRVSENSEEVPKLFSKELVFNSNRLPTDLGEYSINYETGEVFVVGTDIIGEGTARNNYIATYFYRREFIRDLDYSIFNQDLVATPNRDLSNQEAEIVIRYEEVYSEGVDFLAKTHIEVMPEFVGNNLSQSFRVETQNAPITDVFRVYNQTTGEVYNPQYHTDTEIVFSGNRSPEIKTVLSEEASFKRVVDEELSVVGEFVVPAFRATITSAVSNNNIVFEPGIPAELISQNSTDYFFREVESNSEIKDVNIRFFGTPNGDNLITNAGINASATAPTTLSEVIIGTKGFIINLDEERILNKNLDAIGNLTNTSLELTESEIFSAQKYFEPIRITPSALNVGGISRAFLGTKGTIFDDNLSRLRKAGDYVVDYSHGLIYLAIGVDQDISIGNARYFYGDIQTRNKNVLSAATIAKKRNSPDTLMQADIIYGRFTNSLETIALLDLEDSLFLFDNETTAQNSEGIRQPICKVLEDYTAVVPYNINSVTGIYSLGDLTGIDLKSSSQANRIENYSQEELVTPVSSGGRNLFETGSVTFDGNIIDFKKKQKRRVFTNGSSLSVTISDSTAATFIEAKDSSGNTVFDAALNITKVGNLQVAGVTSGVGTAIVEIPSGTDLTLIDSTNDFLLDANGDRFRILSIDAIMSNLTVQTPADNNITATVPAIDPIGITEVVVKPTVTIASGQMTIDIPLDSGVVSGALLDISYLTTLIPSVGTPLAIDFRFGFIFADYSYVADEIVVWYEYGDNTLDWSISDTLSEGDEYYVTYKYGALREALRTNFGSLTNIPFFQSFGVNTNRELYRDAIKGTLQSFPKGPTIPAFEELVKSFTKINPDISELAFGNWILGRDYLCPGKVSYEGVLDFAEGKFGDGLIFNDDVVVSVPALSGIGLDEGTLEAWVRPEWAGINNDATLTFDIKDIGEEKVFLFEDSNPFDSEHNWDLIPSSKLIGGTDSTGPGITITNYKSDSSQPYGLNQGVYGIWKEQPNHDRIVKSNFSATMKVGMIGSHFNDLRKVITEAPEIIEPCESDEFSEEFFIVGSDGPGSFVEGPWPTTLASPSSIYSPGSLLLPDGYKAPGLSLNMNEVSGFNFEVSPMISPSGILSIDTEVIPKYNKPHQTNNCKCSISNDIPELSRFNELIIDVELVSAFDFTQFKSENNIVESVPSVFVLVDNEGVFFEVVGFYDDQDNLVTSSIPDSTMKFAVKKFGMNNPSLSAMGSEAINEMLPSGILRMLYKSVDILTKFDYSGSIQEFGFEKFHVLNWSEYHEYQIFRDPKENIVDIYIDGNQNRMLYTDTFFSCNLSFGSTIESEDLKGPFVGILGINLIADLDLLKANGTLFNRYDLEDIYIGNSGFHPSRMPFSINRSDSPNSPVGEPPLADSGEGIFIWFDELCKSPLTDDAGQWIVRAKADRNVEYPGLIMSGTPAIPPTEPIFETITEQEVVTELIIEDGGESSFEIDSIVETTTEVLVSPGSPGIPGSQTVELGTVTLFPTHNFSGVITTDGEFSSVSRAHREENLGGCDLGVICDSTFRYCGNELLENFGWSKIEDSDSDFINTIVGGRETQRGSWRKHGDFITNTSTGIYRMGPSQDNRSCQDEDSPLGNVVYTENPCAGGDYEYIVSLRVADFDASIAGSTVGSFSGAVSGNITGIVPVHINDKEQNIKICLAVSSAGQPLVLIIDGETNSVLDVISYVWNDQGYHEYRVEKSQDLGSITLYIDELLVAQIPLSDFDIPTFNSTSYYLQAHISLYLFDSSLVNSEDYHSSFSPNILDVDLVFYSARVISGDGYLEANDIVINTDSKIEFAFNIDSLDGYGDGYYDAYDGYSDVIGVDEMFIVSDRSRYLVDTAIGSHDGRFSIFKDGKGFLNFRIFDDSLSRSGETGLFNLATNIKHFKPGELHHIAASWKFNTIEEQDEMHLFIDGQEAPNIFKFGGKVPVRLGDKFRDISKEVLYDFLVDDIDFCDIHFDGTISAGTSIFQSSSATFDQSMIGRSIIFRDSILAPDLVGQEYVIKSVIDSNQITFGRGSNLDLVTFQISTGDIEFQFPPTAGVKSPILTDLRNSRIAIFRTLPNGSTIEMAGLFYSVSNGEVNIIKGTNVLEPQFRVNLDTRLIEFVGQDSLCNYVTTVEPIDIDIHIRTYGLNLENCKHKLKLSSSSFKGADDLFDGQSVIKSRGAEPVALGDVRIIKTILDRTVIDIIDPVPLGGDYQADFDISLLNENCEHLLTSQSGAISKQNLGRLLTVFFDSDNVNYCQFDGYEDAPQDGYLDGEINTITVYGTTIDGTNEETFYVNKNGNLNGSKYFTSVDRVAGSLMIMDPDYFEAGLIELRETNSISVSDNGGESAEVFDYKNGHFVLTIAGSGGTSPFEIHPGIYKMEYPAYMHLNLPEVGHDLFVGSDFEGKNQFGGIIDQFKVISELSSDTRVTEVDTSGTRSVTDDYNKAIPNCPDSQTLILLPFNNPIDLQSRRLRNTEFLDGDTNVKFTLSRDKQELLLSVVNDSNEFISRMLNFGFTLEESTKTFYEVHKAEGGPLFNIAEFYRNVEEFPKSQKSVNSSFAKSGNFTSGKGLLLLNDDAKFRKDEGTIEFWVSPAIDTFVDLERRYYVDITAAKRERLKSKTSTVIELPNPASEIISVKLLRKTKEFEDLYNTNEAQTILFDEVSRNPIRGVLGGGTGSEKDFSLGATLSADGQKILLAESLPGQSIDVVVTYLPLNSNGDRVSIFKSESNQIIFAITAGGIDNFVSIDIDWKKNTWHKITTSYKTNSSFDTMNIFVDGEQGGFIRYGTGILYGEGYVYGQFAQGTDQVRNSEFTIPLTDEFKVIAIGSDVFGSNNSRSRMDNVRFSRIARSFPVDSTGTFLDLSFSSNPNTASPVVDDDATTLLINFDTVIERIDRFITLIDPKSGIYNFDIEVIDDFDKVIGINDGEIEDLIVELVNRLKPAHTNALVKFTKSRC